MGILVHGMFSYGTFSDEMLRDGNFPYLHNLFIGFSIIKYNTIYYNTIQYTI